MTFTNAQLRQFKKKLFEGKLTENSPNIQGQRITNTIGPKEPVWLLVKKGILSAEDESFLQEMYDSFSENQGYINVDEILDYFEGRSNNPDSQEDGYTELGREIVLKLQKAKVVTVFGL